jgi:hypothetical protein
MNDMAGMLTPAKDLPTKVITLARQPLFANAGYLTGINLVGSVPDSQCGLHRWLHYSEADSRL